MSGSVTDVAEQVARALKDARSGLQDLLTKVAELGAEVKSIREEVRLLSRIILEGNGHESMMARVSVLDREVWEAKAWIEDQRKKEEAYRREQVRSRWHLLTAATPGLITFLWWVISSIARR